MVDRGSPGGYSDWDVLALIFSEGYIVMSDLHHEFPEVVDAQNEMDQLLSKLAGLQKAYAGQITSVLESIPKNRYHGQVLELCHDSGVMVNQHRDFFDSMLFGGEQKKPCSDYKSECGAPVVKFAEYEGSLGDGGHSLGTEVTQQYAYDSCAANTECVGFASADGRAPFSLYGSSGTHFKPGSGQDGRAFIKNGRVSVPKDSNALGDSSLGVPTKIEYVKLENVRVLSASEMAAYTAFLADYPDPESAAEEFGSSPMTNPTVSSSAAPLPAAELHSLCPNQSVQGAPRYGGRSPAILVRLPWMSVAPRSV